ncbi:MAG: methyltransferase [Porticoccaceae bacterium]|nr:methyltransferase [Porticoccaceae bacterium]
MNSRHTPDPAAFFMNTIMGFWLGPTLWVTVRLQLAERVAAGPRTAAVLAAEAGVDRDHLRRILNALASVGIFQRDGEQYGATAYSALLCQDHPGGLAQLIDTSLGGQNFVAWSSLEEAVRTGGSAFDIHHGMDWIEYLDRHPERRDIFATAMTATTRATEEAVLSHHDFGYFERVVDIGGSHASLVGRLLERYPEARGAVFDLPDTVEAGRRSWRNAPFASRLEAVGGNFFEAVPEGDLYLLKLILHDWQDEQAVAILATIRKAIRPAGRVAIIETVLPDDGSPHLGWALDIAMMVTTGGRERSLAEHTELLRRAGFAVTGCDPTPSMYSVIEARPV